MTDTLLEESDISSGGESPASVVSQTRSNDSGTERRRYVLEDDTGFDEVPKKYRRFYRRWRGAEDSLAPNEVVCPVCKVVIRSARELWVGDRVYCMACMTRMRVVLDAAGRLVGEAQY